MREHGPFLVLALVCGLVVSAVAALARAPIEDSESRYRQRRLLALVGDETATLSPADDHYLVHRRDRIIAVIIDVASRQGYNGDISLLMSLSPAGSVIGLSVTDHGETPGLGDGIEHGWLDQLAGRTLASDWRVRKDGGDVDQLTGATITSRAVLGAVRDGLDRFQRERTAWLSPPTTVETRVR